MSVTPATLTVPEAARLLGVSRALGYELARSGRLPVLRLGPRRLVVPTRALEAMLAAPAERPTSGSVPIE
jgi:excisionase family DNA binding protein